MPSISFFLNVGNNFEIDEEKRFLIETNGVVDLVLKAIRKYSPHPSTLNMKEKMKKDFLTFGNISY